MTTENRPIDLEMLDATFGKEGREDIISTFISHSGVLFPQIDAAFEARNIDLVIDIAHQFKGMCASVYAHDVSGKALILERLAKESDPDWAQMADALAVLKSGFATLASYLNAHS